MDMPYQYEAEGESRSRLNRLGIAQQHEMGIVRNKKIICLDLLPRRGTGATSPGCSRWCSCSPSQLPDAFSAFSAEGDLGREFGSSREDSLDDAAFGAAALDVRQTRQEPEHSVVVGQHGGREAPDPALWQPAGDFSRRIVSTAPRRQAESRARTRAPSPSVTMRSSSRRTLAVSRYVVSSRLVLQHSAVPRLSRRARAVRPGPGAAIRARQGGRESSPGGRPR